MTLDYHAKTDVGIFCKILQLLKLMDTYFINFNYAIYLRIYNKYFNDIGNVRDIVIITR